MRSLGSERLEFESKLFSGVRATIKLLNERETGESHTIVVGWNLDGWFVGYAYPNGQECLNRSISYSGVGGTSHKYKFCRRVDFLLEKNLLIEGSGFTTLKLKYHL